MEFYRESQKEHQFGEVEISDNGGDKFIHCIDQISNLMRVFLVGCFILMVISNDISCAMAGPDTKSQEDVIKIPKKSRKNIKLTYLIKELKPEENFINIYLKFTRNNTKHAITKSLEKRMTITLFNDLKEITLDSNQKSLAKVTFEENKEVSNKVLIFKKKIQNFNGIEIMLDLENDFPNEKLDKAILEWIVDSPIRRPKISAAQISQLSILIFSFLSLLINGPSNNFDIFTLALIVLGILSVNPFILFFPDVEVVYFLSPVFGSIFIAVFRIYTFLGITHHLTQSKKANTHLFMFMCIFVSVISLNEMLIEFTNHFKSLKIVINPSLLFKTGFVGNIIYLILFIYLSSLAFKKSSRLLSGLPVFIIALICNVINAVVMFCESTEIIESTLYKQISISNSSFVIAVCYFSFFRLSVKKNPKDGMKIIQNNSENI